MKKWITYFWLFFFLMLSFNRVFGEIVILLPKKGEIWKSGEKREIKWQASPEIAKINILYLTNDGRKKVGVIAQGIENVGSFIWRVPQKHALVRLIIKGYDSQGLKTKAISQFFEITPMIARKARWISLREKSKVAEVDVSEQKNRVYENGILIFEAVLSTGVGNATPFGTFRVVTKPKNAKGSCHGPYKSAWSKKYHCWMPWWVGLEGIPGKGAGDYGLHGPPYTGENKKRFKYTPWGRPSSRGCIRQYWDFRKPIDFNNKAKKFQELFGFPGMTVVIQK